MIAVYEKVVEEQWKNADARAAVPFMFLILNIENRDVHNYTSTGRLQNGVMLCNAAEGIKRLRDTSDNGRSCVQDQVFQVLIFRKF